jgi:methionine-rich copper-binding protein CopC
MKLRKYMKVMLSGLLVAAAGLQAHTMLQTSTPADGAVLDEAPETLELGFGADVQLLKLEIATDAGAVEDMKFTPVATAAKSFSVPLPALEPAAYLVTWTILGADGHRMEGTLSFLVDETAHEPADAESEEDPN